jgi:hypothetical protein
MYVNLAISKDFFGFFSIFGNSKKSLDLFKYGVCKKYCPSYMSKPCCRSKSLEHTKMEVMCKKFWMSVTPTLSMSQLNQDPRAFWVDMRGGNKLNV